MTNRRTAALLLGLTLALARAVPAQDALPDYVTRPDPSYKWSVKSEQATPLGKVVEIDAGSGTFRLNSDGEVTDHQSYERFEMHTDVYEVVCP